VPSEAGLAQRLERWLEAPEMCAQDGERAKRELESHRGAVRRTMEVIRELLSRTAGPVSQGREIRNSKSEARSNLEIRMTETPARQF